MDIEDCDGDLAEIEQIAISRRIVGLEAENARLRAALEEIIARSEGGPLSEIARETLAEQPNEIQRLRKAVEALCCGDRARAKSILNGETEAV